MTKVTDNSPAQINAALNAIESVLNNLQRELQSLKASVAQLSKSS